MNKKLLVFVAILTVASLMLASCQKAETPAAAPAATTAATTAPAEETKLLKVFGAYATPIEEPWDGVIHAALQAEADAGKIDYSITPIPKTLAIPAIWKESFAKLLNSRNLT